MDRLTTIREISLLKSSAIMDLPNSENSEVKKPGDSYAQTFARGLAVIKTFNAQRPTQTLTEVAEATGLARAGARRILLTLVHLGYVEAHGRRFQLTPKILDLGFAYLSSMPFWDTAEPIVEMLVRELQQSSSIAVLDGSEIVFVLRVPIRKIMMLNLSIGSRLPASHTSMGRVLLAGLPEEELEANLAALASNPEKARIAVDIEELRKTLAEVREQGWAMVNQELDVGLITMAAPIYNRNGRVIAAINTSSPAGMGSKAHMKQCIAPLKAAADKISELVKMRT